MRMCCYFKLGVESSSGAYKGHDTLREEHFRNSTRMRRVDLFLSTISASYLSFPIVISNCRWQPLAMHSNRAATV